MIQTESERNVKVMTSVAIWSVVANIIMGVLVIFLLNAYLSKKVEAYGLMDNGQAIPLVPLTEEFQTESRVNAFAAECLRQSFEHDFEHYRRSVQEATSCFTGSGVDSYISQITPLTKFIATK